VPRRRDAIKYRELPTLLRDARPTLGEIGDRSAIEALVKIYRAAEKRGDLARLDVRVRNFYEDLRASGHARTRACAVWQEGKRAHLRVAGAHGSLALARTASIRDGRPARMRRCVRSL
jgi:hypothetical protein